MGNCSCAPLFSGHPLGPLILPVMPFNFEMPLSITFGGPPQGKGLLYGSVSWVLPEQACKSFTPPGLLQPLPVPHCPSNISLDFITGLPSSEGNTTVLWCCGFPSCSASSAYQKWPTRRLAFHALLQASEPGFLPT